MISHWFPSWIQDDFMRFLGSIHSFRRINNWSVLPQRRFQSTFGYHSVSASPDQGRQRLRTVATLTEFQCFSLVGDDVNWLLNRFSRFFQDVSRIKGNSFLLFGKESWVFCHGQVQTHPRFGGSTTVDKREAVPLHAGLSQHSPHPDREHAQIRSRAKRVSCLPSPQTCQTLKDIKEHKTYYTTSFSLVHSCSHAGAAVMKQKCMGITTTVGFDNLCYRIGLYTVWVWVLKWLWQFGTFPSKPNDLQKSLHTCLLNQVSWPLTPRSAGPYVPETLLNTAGSENA